MKKWRKWRRGVLVITTAQLYSTSLNWGSAQVQILLAACWRFEMVRISDMVPAGNKAKRLSSINHTTKTIHHHHHHHHHHHQKKKSHSDRFRHIQVLSSISRNYSGVFKTLCNFGIIRAVVYLELWQIQNQKHIQNPRILRTLAYSFQI